MMSKIVRYNLDKCLSNNLCKYLLSTVSNMLALDFETRNEKTTTIEYFSLSCAKKIKIKILDQVFLEKSFVVALNLFIIAISPDDTYTEDITSKINQNISKENLAKIIIQNLHGNQNFADITQDLISDDKNIVDKINFLASQSSLISNLDKDKGKDIENKIDQYCKTKNQIKSTISSTKNLFSSLGALVLTAGLLTSGALLLGPLSSFVIIPVVLAGIKYGGKIGEKIADKAILTQNNIKESQAVLDSIKKDFSKLKQHAHHKTKEKEPMQQGIQDISQHIERGIITSLSKHINDQHHEEIPNVIIDNDKKIGKTF